MIGNRICETRKSKKMTQIELAEKAGISRFTLMKIENGQSPNASAATIANIARALGVSTDFLLFAEC